MSGRPRSTAFWAVWGAVIALAFLHQDLWFWSDRRLILGVLPIGLAYHALFSLCAALVWALAVRFAWPDEIEAWADTGPGAQGTDRG